MVHVYRMSLKLLIEVQNSKKNCNKENNNTDKITCSLYYKTRKTLKYETKWDILFYSSTVRANSAGDWCEGAVYLTSPGRPTDIGLQLGKACYPCSG